MNLRDIIIISIIYISVGFFPADIFLYAQTSENIKNAELLLEANKLHSLEARMSEMYLDSLNYSLKDKANFYYLLGKYNEKKDKEELALKYLQKAENLFEKLTDYKKIAEIQYAKFQVLDSRINIDVKANATYYLKKYYDYAIANKEDEMLIKALMGYASVNFNPENYNKSLYYFDKAGTVCERLKDTLCLAKINNNKGIILSNFYRKQDSARIFYKKAWHLFKLLKDNEKLFNATLNIGTSFKNEHDEIQAIKWLHRADSISIIAYKNNSRRILYGLLSDSYENLKKYKKSHYYLKKYVAYKDSVDIRAQNIAISDIETKYQTEKKEKENVVLIASKIKQQAYLYTIAATFIVSLILGFLALMNLKKKRALADINAEIEHQKLNSLIKEQELTSMYAMIEGQEKERKRIAEDLHDNLGSKLAVLKLQINSILEKTPVNKKKEIKLLTNSSQLIDETYKTVRGMAHIEHAGFQEKQGLLFSIQSLAEKISLANKTQIQVIDFGLETPMRVALKIDVFRIIQELLTNIVRHANAEFASIDLVLDEELFTIIVADDGIGFDENTLNNQKIGLGLESVKEKVKLLKGKFVIDSSVGNGTSIIINLPVD